MRTRPSGEPIRMPIREEPDVAIARTLSRELALDAGFPEARASAVAIAVSEVAWNIVVHAGAGEIEVAVVEDGGRVGIEVVARDDDPGIPDVEKAMEDGWSTAPGLGLGLSSARRLMDEFALASSAGTGTRVTMTKWIHDPE